MSGESNAIKYSLEPQFIDMGLQLFDRSVDRDLVITNNGKVRQMHTTEPSSTWGPVLLRDGMGTAV